MRGTILIVDDSAMMRKIVLRALTLAGLDFQKVLEAGDGREALELLRAHTVELIMCDINMPVMSGLELLRAKREQNLAHGNDREQRGARSRGGRCRGQRLYPETVHAGSCQAEGVGPAALEALGPDGPARLWVAGQDANRSREGWVVGAMATVLSDSKSARVRCEMLTLENLLFMDETVKEVFAVMLGIEIEAEGEIPSTSGRALRHEQTAIVGFAGAMSGICEISVGTAGSLAITGAMLGGVEVDAVGESVCDAGGELCNMLAGGWKNRISRLDSACSLSVPTVIEGVSYQVHRPASVRVNHRSYKFGENKLLLTLLYDPN